jgi:thymidylate kinase
VTRGKLVVVVGPDGVGKSTFAEGLLGRMAPDGRYFHFRPPVRGPLAQHVPDSVPLPKRTQTSHIVVGWFRLMVSVARFWLGYLGSVRPELRRGVTVVADRWAYGYLVQPTPLGFSGPRWLARLAVAVLPRPDVVFNLAASSETVRARKAELTLDEIERELRGWAQIPGPVVTIDASQSPEAMVCVAAGHLP